MRYGIEDSLAKVSEVRRGWCRNDELTKSVERGIEEALACNALEGTRNGVNVDRAAGRSRTVSQASNRVRLRNRESVSKIGSPIGRACQKPELAKRPLRQIAE